MPYSRRVAAWLFGLVVALFQKCGYFSDLEMISFWLLCLKLLRATTGVKRTNGNELTEGCSSTQRDQENFPEAVAIETRHLSEMATVSDNNMDSMETEKAKSKGSLEEEEKNGIHADLGKYTETEKGSETAEVHIMDNGEASVLDSLENGDDSGRCVSCEDESLLLVSESTELNQTEVMTSSVSDTPSSTGGICENTLPCIPQETLAHEKTDNSIPREEPGVTQIPGVPEHTEALVLKSESTELNQADLRTSSVSESLLSTGSVSENILPCKPQETLGHQNNDNSVPTEESEVNQIPVVPENTEPLVLESESAELNRTESMTSSVSDSPSSTGSVCENVLPCKPQETLTHEKKVNSIPTDESEINQFPDIPENIEALVLESEATALTQTKSMTLSVSDPPSNTESKSKNMLSGKPQETLPDEKEDSSVPTEGYEINRVPEVAEHTEATWAQCEAQDIIQGNPTQQEANESILEKCIREETSSDISTESCHNLDQDDLSDCLQVEMAIVSSDSESDDKWRAIFSSSVNKEDDNEIFLDNSQDTIIQEHFEQKRDTEGNFPDLEQKHEVEIPDYVGIIEQPESLQEGTSESQEHLKHISTQSHNLHERSEDKEEVAPNSVKHRTYSIQSAGSSMDKKLPSDYCVIQETKSENVSMEHVDFQLARKQWLKMEEQTKQHVLQPTIKQGTCQGGHSLLYTPVRNIEKPKKDPEFDSLTLREQAYTQFSPCSEDSGLGDSSYRSPYEDPETPIEREIRLAMEREESLRRERGISKSPGPGECLQARKRPATLLTGKFNRIEERKKTSESQRSLSTKTPTFSVAPSPSPKSPSYHEMAANNVIILEPDSYTTGARRYSQGPLSSPGVKKFGEWPSETTNVIILETSNLIIRSASEFCLNKVCQEPQESTFLNNPFFKLRSRSTQSLVEQEIKIVKQREEELKRQRAQLYAKEKIDTVLVSPTLMDSISFDRAEFPVRCKSSPSSPMKTGRKMDRSSLSCDQKFTDSFSRVRRKSAMAMRWEAGEFSNH